MSRAFSTYLDSVRFLAALVVLLSHFAYERFTDGTYVFIRALNLGSDAVVVFFVLSGFVIAFAAQEKDRSFARYAFNRWSRLWSVALPALLLTLACDRLGAHYAPDAYAGWWYSPQSPFALIASGLSFSNEWHALATRLGSNGPYWSLSYEAAYYVLFGIAFFLRGWQRAALVAAFALLIGVNILLLAPSWLLGVYVYRRLQRATDAQPHPALVVLAVAPLFVYILLLQAGLPHGLKLLTSHVLGADAFASLRYSDEFLWNGLIGALFAAHLFAVGRLLAARREPLRFARPIGWLAGASFSIYLVHYPVMQMLASLLPRHEIQLFNHIALLVLTLAACFAFAELFERPLARFRDAVRMLATAITRRLPSLATS